MENLDNGRKIDINFFLSDLLGAKALINGKKIGILSDMVVQDGEQLAKVTHFVIGRPWGDPSLIVPTEKVQRIFPKGFKEVILEVDDAAKYEGEPAEDALLLKDHILDKKILDIENREVEVVYDFKISIRGGSFYVTHVDVSRFALFRRMHLTWLAETFYGPREFSKVGLIPWRYIQPLANMGSFKGDVKLNILKDKIAEMPPADIAEILHELPSEQRTTIFEGLDTERASDTLEKIDPNVQRQLINSIKKTKIAKLVNIMTPAQAADVLGVLPWSDAKVIIHMLDKEHAEKVKAILEKNDERVMNFMTREFISASPEKTVGEMRDEYASAAKGKKVVMYIYVIKTDGTLEGVLDIKELLEAPDESRLSSVMAKNPINLGPGCTLKDAYQIFSRYSFRAIPVVDAKERILGVVPYRDVMQLKHMLID